jgi:hypothetical protein
LLLLLPFGDGDGLLIDALSCCRESNGDDLNFPSAAHKSRPTSDSLRRHRQPTGSARDGTKKRPLDSIPDDDDAGLTDAGRDDVADNYCRNRTTTIPTRSCRPSDG